MRDLVKRCIGQFGQADQAETFAGDFRPPPEAHRNSVREMRCILEAVHLRKYFPLNTFKIIGPCVTAHAVEDTSLKLYPSRAWVLVGEDGSVERSDNMSF